MNLKPAHPRPKSHRSDLAANATAGRSQIAKRRSNRMALQASVGLAGEDRQKCSFTMPAKATKLNKHGAAVQLNRELLVGSVVTVNNKHGTELSARVVAQLAALEGGVSTYAIEFVEQDERATTFWGIIFPPNTSNA
jgi:CO/xanthine dehydrogenase Mo-binding subunit